MNGKQLAGRTITVELSGRPPKEGKAPAAGGRRDDDYRADRQGNFGGGGGGRTLGSSDTATKNLFVGNIPPDATEMDVQNHFSRYGPVQGVKFLPKKSDTIAAFVDFQNIDDARAAHDSSNEVSGSTLHEGVRPDREGSWCSHTILSCPRAHLIAAQAPLRRVCPQDRSRRRVLPFQLTRSTRLSPCLPARRWGI
jgi:hypothetical protein